MKKRYQIHTGSETVEREYNYIPFRYIFAILLTVLEILAVIGIVIACCYYIPYFYIAAWLTEIFCVIKIIASDDNPDYKVPWLLFVLILPIAGFMLYFLFYSRRLQKKFVRRLDELKRYDYKRARDAEEKLAEESRMTASCARMLCKISGAHLFCDTKQTYFPSGEDMFAHMLVDLECAETFIFMEYFIIEEGKFWDSILEILKRKAKAGVCVRVLYDDVGCMGTLPGNYAKILKSFGIEALPFSRLRGSADSEFNNRSHRKILVIDGKIGYTGGVNIADEYINEKVLFGHWKDTAIRLHGEAVWELTRLFLSDWGINSKVLPKCDFELYPQVKHIESAGYLIPFGDGPNPLYTHRVGKSAIMHMLSSAERYVYMTTPYLIIDNELCQCIENAVLRGVDVRIVVPHIPDKRIVFEMTKSYYTRLVRAGVRVYEYEKGFIHAKSYLADGKCALIGTINLDYRSLVHHFENGVWMYRTESIRDIQDDIDATIEQSIEITPDMLKTGLLNRLVRSVVRIFAPML